METKPQLVKLGKYCHFIFFTASNNNLISFLRCGDNNFDDTKNRKVLMPAITFIKDLQRYNEQPL